LLQNFSQWTIGVKRPLVQIATWRPKWASAGVCLAMSVNGNASSPVRRADQHRRLFKPGFGLPLDDAELSAA